MAKNQDLTGKERLLIILENEAKTAKEENRDGYGRLTVAQFARELGLSSECVLRDILRGKTTKISLKLANKIHEMKPKYNLEWLLHGTGEMLNPLAPKDKIPEKSTQDAIATIAMLADMLNKKDEDIRKLLLIIEDANARIKNLEAIIDNFEGSKPKGETLTA